MLYLILLLLLVGLVCGAISLVSSQNKKTKLETQAFEDELKRKHESEQRAITGFDPAFEQEWQTLAKFDATVRAAVERLNGHGPDALNELKTAYKVIRDKSQLAAIAEQIATQPPNPASPLLIESDPLVHRGRKISADPNGTFWVGDEVFASLEEAKAFIERTT
jgi:hypothetical protein